MGAGLSARSGSTGAALYRPKDSQFGTVSLQRSNAMPDMSSKQVASVCCKTLGLPCVLVQPDGWARGEREGYGGP